MYLEYTSHCPHHDDTAMDTPLPRYTVTHQELVVINTAIHTPSYHVSPRGAHTHRWNLSEDRLSGHGHPQRFQPDCLATNHAPGKVTLGPSRQVISKFGLQFSKRDFRAPTVQPG